MAIAPARPVRPSRVRRLYLSAGNPKHEWRSTEVPRIPNRVLGPFGTRGRAPRADPRLALVRPLHGRAAADGGRADDNEVGPDRYATLQMHLTFVRRENSRAGLSAMHGRPVLFSNCRDLLRTNRRPTRRPAAMPPGDGEDVRQVSRRGMSAFVTSVTSSAPRVMAHHLLSCAAPASPSTKADAAWLAALGDLPGSICRPRHARFVIEAAVTAPPRIGLLHGAMPLYTRSSLII
jgi:hypothetical protein